MIDPNRQPPFTAYRMTPRRRVAPVEIVEVTQWGSARVFVSDRRGHFYPEQLWLSEREALEHVARWIGQRKADLRAELAKLDATELRTITRLGELPLG